MDVLFNPLIFAFCESISLWVKHCTDILSYAQLCGQCSCKVGCKARVSIRDYFQRDSEPWEQVFEV